MSNTLTNYLQKLPTIYTTSNRDWVRFVKDHIFFLQKNSYKIELNVNDLHKYRYRPKFLFKPYNTEEEDAWIVLVTNNLPISTGIPIHVSNVMIPTPAAINYIKEQFASYASSLVHK